MNSETTTEYKNILVEIENGIATITINREDKMNALNVELLRELETAVDKIVSDRSIVGAILTGKGEKAFAAGADISELASLKRSEAEQLARNGHRVFNKIEQCPKPFVAIVNGFALGGGCELAMACHLRLATPNAMFGQPEVNLGIIPGYGGTQRLVQLIGKAKALEHLMTGDMIDASEAHRLGLANAVVDTDGIAEAAAKTISKIARKAPLAIAKVIESVNAYFTDGTDGFEFEIDRFASCVETSDFKEGTSAFLEKRKPTFKGE